MSIWLCEFNVLNYKLIMNIVFDKRNCLTTILYGIFRGNEWKNTHYKQLNNQNYSTKIHTNNKNTKSFLVIFFNNKSCRTISFIETLISGFCNNT